MLFPINYGDLRRLALISGKIGAFTVPMDLGMEFRLFSSSNSIGDYAATTTRHMVDISALHATVLAGYYCFVHFLISFRIKPIERCFLRNYQTSISHFTKLRINTV